MRPDPDDIGPDADGDARVLDLLSSMDDQDAVRHQPPADLWDSIAARLPSADQPTVITSPEPDDVRVAPAARPRADRGSVDPGSIDPVVVDLDARRERRWAPLVAAAAVVVLAAGTFGVLTSLDDPPTQELVASVELEALQDRGTGEAELVSVDGEQRLVVRADDLGPSPEGTHYEMWLIDAGITDIRSVGVLPDGVEEIEVPVPAGVDPEQFPIVDINVQQDGQEQHSGVDTSVLRGEF
jgi:hypothetical protein